MRSLAVMNRIDIIIRPAEGGFNFSCQNKPQCDQRVIADNIDKDQDGSRYRRK